MSFLPRATTVISFSLTPTFLRPLQSRSQSPTEKPSLKTASLPLSAMSPSGKGRKSGSSEASVNYDGGVGGSKRARTDSAAPKEAKSGRSEERRIGKECRL